MTTETLLTDDETRALIQALRTGIAVKNNALRAAQQMIGSTRPQGNSNPDLLNWDADAALWDYYQHAIDYAMEHTT